MARLKLVTRHHQSQLPGNRDGPERAIGLSGAAVSVTVYLPTELDLRIIEIAESDVRPCEPEQLRKPCAGEGGHDE
jgi:hypothetical protein